MEWPALAELAKDVFPADVIARAKELKAEIGSIGAYSHSQGVPYIRKNVARFIEGQSVPSSLFYDAVFFTPAPLPPPSNVSLIHPFRARWLSLRSEPHLPNRRRIRGRDVAYLDADLQRALGHPHPDPAVPAVHRDASRALRRGYTVSPERGSRLGDLRARHRVGDRARGARGRRAQGAGDHQPGQPEIGRAHV